MAPSGTLRETRSIQAAERIMMRFAERTGLFSERPHRRYLWTDAFAVCNFIALARDTGQQRYLELAERVVEAVHYVLGRYRADDSRSGWLSGLSESEGEMHPTRGGLRIGKKLSERAPDEPFDPALEWERDGQYFHYLTQWMHALDQLARYTGDARYNLWARELAKTAHDGFVYASPFSARSARMYWKMAIDLGRPLVVSMGQHDPLNGFVTALELRATAATLRSSETEPTLTLETSRFAAMIDLDSLATPDPLGLGGLLMDASRIAQLRRHGDSLSELYHSLLAAAVEGLRYSDLEGELRRSPEHRLAFRELGLSIGLKGIDIMTQALPAQPEVEILLARLREYVGFSHIIEAFWLEPRNQLTESWLDHLDINEVMLTTSLIPEGCLLLLWRTRLAPLLSGSGKLGVQILNGSTPSYTPQRSR